MAPTVSIANNAITYGNIIGARSEYRRVWKTPYGRFVYKELRCDTSDEHKQANLREFSVYLRLAEMTLPVGIYLPKMYLLKNGVLAAEYISGFHPTDQCYYTCCNTGLCKDHGCWRRRLESVGLRDMHENNVKMNGKGEIWLIDIDGGFSTDPAVWRWDVDKTSLGL